LRQFCGAQTAAFMLFAVPPFSLLERISDFIEGVGDLEPIPIEF